MEGSLPTESRSYLSSNPRLPRLLFFAVVQRLLLNYFPVPKRTFVDQREENGH